MKRKWARVTIPNELYCSSSYDYFLDVYLWASLDSDGPRVKRHYHLNSRAFMGYHGGALYSDTPKYVQEMIRAQLHEKLTAGKLAVVEGTADGGHRTTGHRYHDPAYLAQLLAGEEA